MANELLLAAFIEQREYTQAVCMECDGTGEVDMGRDWQRTQCSECRGTSTPWTEDDEAARTGDLLRAEFLFDRSH